MTASPDEDEDGIRAEQRRLALSGVAQSAPIGLVLATMVAGVLHASRAWLVLGLWYAALAGCRIAATLVARRALRRPAAEEAGLRGLLVLKTLEGTAWGSLMPLCFAASNAPIRVMLMTLMGAICSNAVSLFAPVRRLYLCFVLPILALTASTLWSSGDFVYRAIALFCVLYVLGQFGQVRLANARMRDSIGLRFQNLALVGHLREESDVARRARQEAEAANVAKSRFLAAASHDLRQPIHALGLFLEALGYTALDDRQRRTLDHAKAAASASSAMLNTLLDFSRIEAGVVTPRLADIPLQPLLDKLEAELAPLADAKRLVYRSRHCAAWVRSDAALLDLMLRNLITNAIRYTETGGLLVACRNRGERVSIEIYDTGIGIAPAQQREIFREFHQLGNPERDREKGLGLGLAIVDGLAGSLGHRVGVASHVGRGSVFRVEVPRASGGRPHSPTPLAEPEEAADRFAGRRLLVIDDDAIVRAGMAQLLTGWGADCIVADSLEDALGVADRAPHAIICDYRLREGVTGAQVIARLRARWGAAIPALLITGDTAPDRLREAMQSGIPLMHKPVSPGQLRSHLARLVQPIEADRIGQDDALVDPIGSPHP